MHITETDLIVGMGCSGFLLACWYGIPALLRRRSAAAEYYGDERLPAVPEPVAAVAIAHSAPDDRLPDADTRTMMLAQLADPCPGCGGDCGTFCENTGPVAAAEHAIARIAERQKPVTREQKAAEWRAEQARELAILARHKEQRESWHHDTLTGMWLPPADLLETLERGDWLHELLAGVPA